jgi:hypothetical protein
VKRGIYALLVFLVASTIRLYPTLITGMPYSTDSWPPIRNTELLLELTPIDLRSNAFDGYNNYWPANSLFGAVLSLLLGVEPRQAMPVTFPVLGAFAVLIFYVLVEDFTGSEVALMASLVFGTALSHTILTGAVTKETYANPLYLLLVLAFLRLQGARQMFLFALASVALALTHHLTPVVTIAFLSSMALARLLVGLRRGLRPPGLDIPLVGILAIVTLADYLLYAYPGFKLQLTPSDWISAISYQLFAFVIASYVAFKGPNPLLFSASLAIPLSLSIVTFRTPIASGAPVLPPHYLIYAAPLLLATPLSCLGLKVTPSKSFIFWLASVLGLGGYAVFWNPIVGVSLAYRMINFMWPPLAFLCAAGLHQLYIKAGRLRTRAFPIMLKASVVLTVIAITAVNSYGLYASVSRGERYLGYFWVYTHAEYAGGLWLAHEANDQKVAGDVKVASLLSGYFNMRVDPYQGLRYLEGEGSERPPYIYTYEQMLRNGYVIGGGYSIDLPSGWPERLYGLNLLYSNAAVNIYG